MSETNKNQVIKPIVTHHGTQMRKVRRNGKVCYEPLGNGYVTALINGQLNTVRKGNKS